MVWPCHKCQQSFPCHAIKFTLDKRRRGRQGKKMGWQRHWVDWKVIHRDSDIGTHLKHTEGAGQVLRCTVTAQPYLVMGLIFLLNVCRILIFYEVFVKCLNTLCYQRNNFDSEKNKLFQHYPKNILINLTKLKKQRFR